LGRAREKRVSSRGKPFLEGEIVFEPKKRYRGRRGRSLSGDEVIQVIPEQFNAKTTLGFEATRKNLGQSLNHELQ